MSGIAGYVRADGAPPDADVLQPLAQAMADRGPDGVSEWSGPGAALAQLLFHTTPQSLSQPRRGVARIDERLVLVMDGRIDNAVEVRRALGPSRRASSTATDEDLLLDAYEAWGEDCLARLDGDFALAIWNARERTLFCARDRIGQRPFHYWHQGAQFVFASDFHAILAAPGSPRRINEGMLAEHLSVYPQTLDETLIEGISRLPPAHWLRFSARGVEIARYWHVPAEDGPSRSDAEYIEEFHELFADAVRRSTRAVGPVGIYCSGGLDSSSIFCAAARPGGALAPVHGHALVYPHHPESDERRFIDMASTQAGLPVDTLAYQPVGFAQFVRDIGKFRDVGNSPNGAILAPLRLAARAQGSRVLLTGLGGDEWFARSHFFLSELIRTFDVGGAASELRRVHAQGASWSRLAQIVAYHGISPLVPEPLHAPVRWARRSFLPRPATTSTGAGGFARPEFAARVALDERLAPRDRSGGTAGPGLLEKHRTLSSGLAAKTKEVDSRELAGLGVEERHPFHDRRIVEFALRVPERMRSASGGKHVLREAMRGVLPEGIRVRPDKGDFSHVIAHTLTDPLLEQWIDCPRLHARGFVDTATVREQYATFRRDFAAGRPLYRQLSWKLWATVSLEVWLSVLDCK